MADAGQNALRTSTGLCGNASFGGVERSGLGREGCSEGIAEYSTPQDIGLTDLFGA